MSFNAKPKRKNDHPPPFPAWIIVLIAIGLVIIVALFFQPATSSQSAAVSQPQGNIELTATYIIEQATASAQGASQPVTLDPILLTATAIVQEATMQASTPGS